MACTVISDRKSTRLNSSHLGISYAVFCLKKKNEADLRYKELNLFEHLTSSHGTTILKFFLHISKDEQRKRLQARIDDPLNFFLISPAPTEISTFSQRDPLPF